VKLSTVCVVALAAALAIAAPSAFAGTTIGATCTATSLGSDIIFNESHAVTSDGVITSWGSTVSPSVSIPNPTNLRLKVVRLVGGSTWKVVSESGFSQLANGANAFAVQIPVKTGDVVGSWAAGNGSPYCTSTPSNDFRYDSDSSADVAVGSTFAVGTATGIDNAIWATVEADADGDGFGDDTQDHCPNSATSQSASACPAPPVSTYIDRTSRALTVYASAKLPVPLQVTAKVNVPKQKPISLTSAAATVTPFGITPFKLSYSKALRKAIAAAPKKKPLKITVTVLGGTPLASIQTASVKLTPIKN
jgi:hypothetical protein